MNFATTAAALEYYNVYSGYNFLKGQDYPGILYIDPLPRFLLSNSNTHIIQQVPNSQLSGATIQAVQ